jgi:hypothetical protein
MKTITTPHQQIVNAMLRGDWSLADYLTQRVAEASAQDDFDAVYGAAYATYLDQK